MSLQSQTGFDANSQRITNVGAPTSASDGVPKNFLRYILSFPCVGKPAAGEVLGFHVLTDAITIPANLAGSYGRALTAATASAAFTLTRIPAGSTTETTIATITFAASGTLATFSTQAAVLCAAGDIIRLKAPATADSTLTDITFSIPGAR